MTNELSALLDSMTDEQLEMSFYQFLGMGN